jgi:hypothetical protein
MKDKKKKKRWLILAILLGLGPYIELLTTIIDLLNK